MNPILTEENQYSKFAFKNFEKVVLYKISCLF